MILFRQKIPELFFFYFETYEYIFIIFMMRKFVWLYTLFCKKKIYLKNLPWFVSFKSKLSCYKKIRYIQYDNELMLAISLSFISKIYINSCVYVCVFVSVCVLYAIQLTLNSWREFWVSWSQTWVVKTNTGLLEEQVLLNALKSLLPHHCLFI